MPGKSPAEREALERQNAAILGVFEAAGFEHIAPDIVQPADIFLERSGEDIRERTFVFTDPQGYEMCLRPDLTVPACRYHLSHAASPEAESRYCYLGPAFRVPQELHDAREFTQAGLEWFGGANPVAQEALVLKLTIAALEAAGLKEIRVTLGDLGLFASLLEDTGMPERWRRKLRHHFWRPSAFRDLLESFCGERKRRRTSISALVDRVEEGDGRALVEGELLAGNLPLVGGREISEIAARLAEKAADRRETPLAQASADQLNSYLAIETKVTAAGRALAKIAARKHFTEAVQDFTRRVFEMQKLGLDADRYRFKAAFGRELEYYTGLIFQIEAASPHGWVAVAGGGRYDDLLFDMGAPMKVPAVGCAIHTDRLQALRP